MKRLILCLAFTLKIGLCTTITIYSDWGWGYYFWLFGWVGPNQSEGVTAAGYSGSIEYRGYTQFSMPGYPGPGTTINGITLRLCNNTGGTGLSININRVTSDVPGGNECGVPPFYLSNQPVNSGVEEYTYFDLTSTQAKDDFLNAWQSGADWFGFGYSGTGPMHFFYACWFDPYLDAALIINYTIGVDENEDTSAAKGIVLYPNPFNNYLVIRLTNYKNDSGKEPVIIKVYDIRGREVASFKKEPKKELIIDTGNLPKGVYFVQVKADNYNEIKKIIKIE
ncbi:MAG: T9SS type A sorting domain-containing protein [candidate division WOR-3 bacterium]